MQIKSHSLFGKILSLTVILVAVAITSASASLTVDF